MLTHNPHLKKIVYHQEMVMQLVEGEVFKKITHKWGVALKAVDHGTDEGRVLIVKTHSFFIIADTPPVVNSKKDMEDWVFSGPICPAVWLLQAIRKGEIKEVHKDLNRYSTSASAWH